MKGVAALGLDLGRRRIGVAGCDGLGLTARGLTTISRKSFDLDIAELRRWVVERDATVLVVGLPYQMDGELGKQAYRVQKLAKRIAQALQLPIEFVDERLSSVEAEELMREAGQEPSREKGTVDRLAAALILQRWLDERRGSG
ncbi:Holliday junction resolvase RuvX [Baaleninema simplex]|uniref:Holliday junction resolvase RuvX n=1 Tax=Baaleninema simplex TaxID=2862350 RepID=UPI00034DE0FA|nr:Holliday junction resolvase RuvX [Baaleninema simplex]